MCCLTTALIHWGMPCGRGQRIAGVSIIFYVRASPWLKSWDRPWTTMLPFYCFSVMIHVYINTVTCHAGVRVVFLGVVMHSGVLKRGCGYIVVCACKPATLKFVVHYFLLSKSALRKRRGHWLMRLAWCINLHVLHQVSGVAIVEHVHSYVY